MAQTHRNFPPAEYARAVQAIAQKAPRASTRLRALDLLRKLASGEDLRKNAEAESRILQNAASTIIDYQSLQCVAARIVEARVNVPRGTSDTDSSQVITPPEDTTGTNIKS